jgi:hypothetical protein
MATTPDNPPTREPDGTIGVQSRKGRTWFPILLGVLFGMISWWLLAMLEVPSFYRLTVWIFNEASPKALFAMPAYYCVHRTLLLALAAVGGSIGALFSRWRKRTAFLFLLATLLVIAAFAALGFH